MMKLKGWEKIVIGTACLGLVAVLADRLPQIWFQAHLKRSWNMDDKATAAASRGQHRGRFCLIFAIDGVPHEMMADLHSQGYFKGFYPPGKLISTFPSLTRPAFSKMLVGGKPYGYERQYYNFTTHRLEGSNLIRKAFATEKEHADYHPPLHFLGFPGYIAYVFPDRFTQATLDGFTARLKAFEGDEFIAYVGISDAIAHVEGEAALYAFIKRVSVLLDRVRSDLDIPLDVVLFSDHGNNFAENQLVDLAAPLVRAGFRDVDQLNRPRDFVLPRNGFVSFAAIYTAAPNAPAMAALLADTKGVDFSAYRWEDAIRVHGADGVASIDRRGSRYRYQLLTGDPLALASVSDRLEDQGNMDPQGFADESQWWQATQDHAHPDPLRRIWEGSTDLVQHPGTLLISLKNGYAFGPPIFDNAIVDPRAGTHGALLGDHSYGFFMTDFMPVAAASRPADVAGLLARSTEAKRERHKRTANRTK